MTWIITYRGLKYEWKMKVKRWQNSWLNVVRNQTDRDMYMLDTDWLIVESQRDLKSAGTIVSK